MSCATPILQFGDCVDLRFLVGGWFLLEGEVHVGEGSSCWKGKVHLGGRPAPIPNKNL